MRGLLSRTFPLLLLALALPDIDRLSAQEVEPAVRARLLAQSPWNGPDDPLTLWFSATNQTDEPLEDLSVVLSIWSPARSRSVYEFSLVRDETTFLFGLPFPQEGALSPGATRSFRIRQPLDVLAARGESALYPIKVQLLSHDVPVATIRTPMIFLLEPPQTPLHLVWTWVLSTPLQYFPDGRFLPGPLQGDVAAGGRLDVLVRTLDEFTPGPVDVAISPVLAEQLRRMAEGFQILFDNGTTQPVPAGTGAAADAADILDTLRRVVARPGIELVALPSGDAPIPTLVSSGLGADLDALLEEGRREIQAVLGGSPSQTVIRPPFAQIEPDSASALASLGVRTLLLDAGSVVDDSGAPFSPPPVVRPSGDGPSPAVIAPDPAIPRVVEMTEEDPRLAAQAALGHLAAVWFEFPGTPGRGSAILFSEEAELPPAFVRSFAGLVRRSPWLRRTTASAMVAAGGEPRRQPLSDVTYPLLDDDYLRELLATRAELGRFTTALQQADELEEELRSHLMAAEGAVAAVNPAAGLRFIRRVGRTIEQTYRRVHPPPPGSPPFTLVSQQSSLPVRIANESPYAMRVVVRLVADRRLSFPSGSVRELTLPGEGVELVRIPVQAQATGRFPIKVLVETPAAGGPAPGIIAETELIVRSTAFNRLALLITIGAALFLLAWWGRRFLPRRKA